MSAALDPAVLAWALARPVGDRWRGLAEAFATGTTRVSFDGRTVEYRSLAEISAALTAGHGAENSAARRPGVIVGTITKVRDDSDEIEVEIAAGVRIMVLRGTIGSVVKPPEAANDAKPAAAPKA